MCLASHTIDDPGGVWQFSGTGSPIESFGVVALLTHVDRSRYMDLKERKPRCFMDGSLRKTIGSIGTYHTGKHDNTSVGHQSSNLADPPNVLGTVFIGEAKVGVETVPGVGIRVARASGGSC